MKKPFLIGVSGQYASGKDTVADYLISKLLWHDKWRRAAFASNVKRIFAETFGVSSEFIEKWKREKEAPEGFKKPIREGLTLIGDGFRSIVSNVWIDLLLRDNKDNLILVDVRYLNEVETINNNNGFNILVWRPGHENDFPNESEQQLMPYVRQMKDKPSGVADDPFDAWIVNGGNVEDLHRTIDNTLLPLIKKFLEK